MTPELKQVLLAADEQGAYEFPACFDAADIERRAEGVWKTLAAAGYTCRFESFVYNQDASFGIAILLDDVARDHAGVHMIPTIRFSNFGSLATICEPEALSLTCLSTIDGAFHTYGFSPVPADVLQATAYDGVNAPNDAFPTWWVRYFDWL